MKNLTASPSDGAVLFQTSPAPIPFSVSKGNKESPAVRPPDQQQTNKQNENKAESYSTRDISLLNSQTSPINVEKQKATHIATNRQTEWNPFSSNQSSAVFDPQLPPLELGNPLASSFDKIGESTIRVASVVPRTKENPDNSAPHLETKVDLTPSYAKHLKYVETCGVVVVQANFPLTEIKSILSEIDRLQRDLTLYMGVPQPKEKIELCLFQDEKSYQKFLSDQFPKAPKDRRALYIKLNNEPGTLLVQRTKEFDIDLRHEMTHAIIHASISVVPIWLDEGLAKYFEVPVEDRSEKNPYIKTIRWNVRFGAVPSLRRLERLEHIGEMGNREYRDSWAWVHFMIHHSPETHRLLAGYLQLIHRVQIEAAKNGKPIQDSIDLPTLGPYLNDVVERPREKYREHFQIWGVPQEED